MTTYTWDSTHPATTDTYAGTGAGTVLGSITSNAAVQARMFDSAMGDTINNVVDGQIRVNSANGRVDKYSLSGTVWNALPLANILGFAAAPIASPTFTGTASGAALSFTGNGSFGGTLSSSGAATFSGGVAITGSATIGGVAIATQGYVTGLGYLTSSAAAATYAPLASPTFTGTAAGAALSFTGNGSFGGTLSVTGAASFTAAITSGGNLTATGAILNSATPTIVLQVSGTQVGLIEYISSKTTIGSTNGGSVGFLTNFGANAGGFDTSANFTAVGTIQPGSDGRWKTKVRAIEVGDAISFVKSLSGIASTYRLHDTTESVGYIAQRVRRLKTFGKRLTSQDDQGFWHLDYNGMVAPLSVVMADALRRIETLERRRG